MKKFIGNLRFVYVVYAVLWFCIKGHIGGLFTNKERFYRKRIGPAAFNILRRLNTSIDIEGLENLDPKKTYVLMGNHRSYTDILVVFISMAIARRDVIFMSKKEVFKVPFLGSAMKALGMIPVERSESAEALKSLIKAIQTVKEGKNLVMFPEGTRSIDGNLLPLKRGGFILATRAGMDIAPFVIHGTEKFMPKSGFALYPTNINVKYLPTVNASSLKDKEAMALVEAALRDAI